MGMFDRVWVTCPHCSTRTELQSKAGECLLNDYELHNAPLEVISSLAAGDGWRECSHCGKDIEVVEMGRPGFFVDKPNIFDECLDKYNDYEDEEMWETLPTIRNLLIDASSIISNEGYKAGIETETAEECKNMAEKISWMLKSKSEF